MLTAHNAVAQINFSEDFESAGWTEGDFTVTDIAVCNGAGSLVGNAFEFWGFAIPAEVISPSIGISNGNQVVLSYNYKLLQYDSDLPDTPTPNSPSWGSFTVEYSSSATGPWELLETVNSSNHIESADCAERTLLFTPPAGGEVYLRFLASPSASADFFMYLDDINAITSTGCSGTPAVSAAVALKPNVCLNENVSLSLQPIYTQTGLTFQWQSSSDNITYTNIATGGTGATYSGSQSAATWYRAIITCQGGGQPVTSTPVLVGSTGSVCYCPVTFIAGVEPITLVDFAGINNATSAVLGGDAQEDFTALSPASVVQGQSYTITLEGNTGGDEYTSYFKVFIDFNGNGSFDDAGESFEAGTITGSDGEDGQQATGTIAIPANAPIGLKAMRVIKLYDLYPATGCTDETFGYGQAEDYKVMVQATNSIGEFGVNTIKHFPNPVKDILTVSYNSAITEAEVYNMIGQKVLYQDINANEATIDMSKLAEGNYLVKVASEDGIKTFKVIKK